MIFSLLSELVNLCSLVCDRRLEIIDYLNYFVISESPNTVFCFNDSHFEFGNVISIGDKLKAMRHSESAFFE